MTAVIDVQDLARALRAADPPLVFDVRRRVRIEEASHMLPGARWRDPERIADWIGDVPKDRLVVVYCVHGLEVGQGARERLAARGIDARYLEGGFEAWRDAGLSLVPKENAP